MDEKQTAPLSIEVDGVKYVRADSVPHPRPGGNRAVVVADRGWIFAGDITENDRRIYLDNVTWVFRWERIGFAAVLENPNQSCVDIRPVRTPIDIPCGSEIFRAPVADDWGK